MYDTVLAVSVADPELFFSDPIRIRICHDLYGSESGKKKFQSDRIRILITGYRYRTPGGGLFLLKIAATLLLLHCNCCDLQMCIFVSISITSKNLNSIQVPNITKKSKKQCCGSASVY
jgi:hypothetical protein